MTLNNISNYVKNFFQINEELKPDHKIWHYVFGVLVLFISGLKLYKGIQSSVDIQFADEAAYMRFGLNLFEKLNRDWGPMYTIWYKCLSFFTTDTIRLYYINYVTTSFLIGILLYVFLLRISVHHVFALLISFSVLVSDLNVSVWPRISHFCLVICLLSLILISFLKNNTQKFLVFTLMCLINSYARPEFYISFVMMSFCTIICIYFYRNYITKNEIIIISSAVFLIGILHIIFRFPSNDFFGYNRGVAAFYQHYAWNLKWRTHADFDAWLNWEDIARKQFGDCNSMLCVIKTQPLVVISNTLFNIRNYTISIFQHVFTYVFPVGIFHGKKLQLIFYCLFYSITLILLIRKTSRQYFFYKLYAYRSYLLMLFLFAVPTILSCVVVFPRDHYLYLQMLLMIIILVCLLGYLFKNSAFKSIIFIGFGFLLILSTPNIKKYRFLKTNTATDNLCNKELILQLEKNDSDKPHTLFTNLPFVSGMLPDNFKEINTIFNKKKNIPFQFYMDSAKIDIIILLPTMFRDPHIKTDSSWINFINNFEKYNFRKEKFGDCETYLLIKNN